MKKEIYDEIKRRIITLEYKPGELINDKALSQELNVSRTPIREVLLKLAEENFVTFVPRVGIYVSQIDIKTIRNAYEIKMHLEAMAAELAATRAKDEDIAELMTIVERLKTYDAEKDYKQYIIDDQLFHRKTRQIADNELLDDMLEKLNSHTARFLQHIHYVVDDPCWYFQSIVDIASAIRDRNPEAAYDAARSHMATFLNKLSQQFFGIK
jgi:DNA-binding GntR family transcriptional regulator